VSPGRPDPPVIASTPSIPPALAQRLRDARHVAVLTGAGISAESGIPTFRDALTGLWARYRPEELATPEAFASHPRLVWEWYAWRREVAQRAEPNAGHRALSRLERLVPDLVLVTQNVDGLHQRAGSTRVFELHGNILRTRCSREGILVSHWEGDPEVPPRCSACGAPLRPDVVWFGEPLPSEALQAAWHAASACDLFLSIGTSNLVEPAASLPWRAASAGAEVIVINPAVAGQRAGPRIHHLVGCAGEVLPALLAAAWPDQPGSA
jgi:NAD-dependent deacetylase